MTVEEINRLVRVASKQSAADLVIKNCRIVNVFTHEIQTGDIAICGGLIAGIGDYSGENTIDAGGLFVIPGLIDSHVHIESSFVTPEEFGRAVVPRGTTTVIADPHEIVNVCGMAGLEYMIKASEKTALDVRFMMPSCVPCTEWEDNGATIGAEEIRRGFDMDGVYGLGEFMDAFGILDGNPDCMKKIHAACERGIVIDGHSPGISGEMLEGYLAAGVQTDHECGNVSEMEQRLQNGMYVQLRYGAAAEDLPNLVKGVTEANSRRCIFCTDDLHPEKLLKRGDIDACLKVCVANGIAPITAVQMATLNAAECYGMHDRGAIAPGRRADLVLVENLSDFKVKKVFIGGVPAAEEGRYLPETERQPIDSVTNIMNVKDFSPEKLKLGIKSGRVHVIDVHSGSLITDDTVMDVDIDENGELVFNSEKNVARISVIERHKGTGNVANGLIRGYGIQRGAIAISIGHDSHNILAVGVNAEDMYFAVSKLIEQEGGIVLAENGRILEKLELPVAGLMSVLSAEETAERLEKIHDCAYSKLGVNADVEPIITLCFMALPTIPELKLTDKGLFKISQREFIPLDSENIGD